MDASFFVNKSAPKKRLFFARSKTEKNTNLFNDYLAYCIVTLAKSAVKRIPKLI
jgi:hypothetical protein